MANEMDNIPDLLSRAKAGDEQAVAELFAPHRDRLRKMIRLRLDRKSAPNSPSMEKALAAE